MYIKTPKRYRGVQRRNKFGCARMVFWLILVALIAGAWLISENMETIRPQVDVVVQTAVHDIEVMAATMQAPPPTPTTDPVINIAQGDDAWVRGSVGEALDSYVPVLDARPNDADLYGRVTLGLITQGDLATALNYAEDTVTADPLDAEAWATRAFTLAWDGQAEQAIASALQALDMDPNSARAMAFLAYSYFEAEQYQVASNRANQAVELDPNRFEVYWMRGIIRENGLFDFAGSTEDYQQAFDLAQDQNPAVAGLIAAAIARNQAIREENPDAGIATLETVLERQPDNTTVLYWMSFIQFTYRGDYGETLRVAERCVTVDPNDFNCLYLLGRSHQKLGDQVTALESFERAIALGSPSARTYWWAANMQIALGSCEDATDNLTTGFKMAQPGDLPASDEGAQDLLDAYDYLFGLCPVRNITPDIPTATPIPEATAEPDSEGGASV